jgi:hypothetical protein
MKLRADLKVLSLGLLLSVTALLAATPAGHAGAVDTDTIGTWVLPLNGGRWLWKIDLDGTYEFHSEAADGVAPHAGKVSASGGVWSLQATNGYADGGTYTFQPPDTLVATGHLGTASWHRLANVADDPHTIGTWELSVNGERWLWKIDPNGSYEFHTEAADGIAPHAGKVSASGGFWWLQAKNGYADGGTYTFQSPDTLITTGHLGTATWHQPANAANNAGDEPKKASHLSHKKYLEFRKIASDVPNDFPCWAKALLADTFDTKRPPQDCRDSTGIPGRPDQSRQAH